MTLLEKYLTETIGPNFTDRDKAAVIADKCPDSHFSINPFSCPIFFSKKCDCSACWNRQYHGEEFKP